jgi:hypothetical protein
VYYTWSPDYSGYVATDPPPVADSGGAGPAAAPPPADGQYQAGTQYQGTQYQTDSQYQGDPNASGAGAAPASAPLPPPQAGAGAPLNQPTPQAEEPRMFMYPKSGQNDEQQRTDKLECEKWASDQVGLGSNGPDYQRALGACIQGRGYSIN